LIILNSLFFLGGGLQGAEISLWGRGSLVPPQNRPCWELKPNMALALKAYGIKDSPFPENLGIYVLKLHVLLHFGTVHNALSSQNIFIGLISFGGGG